MKNEFKIMLPKVSDVKEFINISSQMLFDVNIKTVDKTYIVDGKSILGIMSLDLSNPIIVSLSDNEDFSKMNTLLSESDIEVINAQ